MKNTNYKVIKFYGNSIFFAALLLCDHGAHYFVFNKISSIELEHTSEKEWVKNKEGNPLWCFSKDNIGLTVSGKELGYFEFCDHMIPIKPTEFESLCRVLEVAYND